ncbi:MAG: phosphate ABC transporter ATP-binding protein [Anaerolineae bacterium]|nr:phosphate ABC transporter ATP-binding protein [Anaerolineae bacterium]
MAIAPKFHIRDLTYRYGDKVALNNVSLDIAPNAVTTLFGPAGGGKTTLLRLLNRLNDMVEDTHMRGEILLDGQNIYAPGTDVTALRRRVGMVFAVPLPLPMSILDNVTYGPRLSGVRGSRLMEIAERALRQAALWDEVGDRLHDPALALSGGQQQRLSLARVLALEPEVILLDEPTSGLDPISTAKVEESLHTLKQDYTIVIVPHSVQQAARIADHAAFLLMGELVETGPGARLFTRPTDKRTEDYVTGRFG